MVSGAGLRAGVISLGESFKYYAGLWTLRETELTWGKNETI